MTVSVKLHLTNKRKRRTSWHNQTPPFARWMDCDTKHLLLLYVVGRLQRLRTCGCSHVAKIPLCQHVPITGAFINCILRQYDKSQVSCLRCLTTTTKSIVTHHGYISVYAHADIYICLSVDKCCHLYSLCFDAVFIWTKEISSHWLLHSFIRKNQA